MLLAGDLASVRLGAAFHLGWAGLAGVFERLIFRHPLAGRSTVWIRVIAAELFERLAFRADVLVVVRILFEVGARPCSIGTAGFIQHGNVGADVAVNQPAQHWS